MERRTAICLVEHLPNEGDSIMWQSLYRRCFQATCTAFSLLPGVIVKAPISSPGGLPVVQEANHSLGNSNYIAKPYPKNPETNTVINSQAFALSLDWCGGMDGDLFDHR